MENVDTKLQKIAEETGTSIDFAVNQWRYFASDGWDFDTFEAMFRSAVALAKASGY